MSRPSCPKTCVAANFVDVDKADELAIMTAIELRQDSPDVVK